MANKMFLLVCTHAFSLISIIMSCIKHRHMDAYAFIIFSQLYIIDFVIDILSSFIDPIVQGS